MGSTSSVKNIRRRLGETRQGEQEPEVSEAVEVVAVAHTQDVVNVTSGLEAVEVATLVRLYPGFTSGCVPFACEEWGAEQSAANCVSRKTQLAGSSIVRHTYTVRWTTSGTLRETHEKTSSPKRSPEVTLEGRTHWRRVGQ